MELADGDSFPVLNGGKSRRRVCHICFTARKKTDREERGIGVPAPRPPEALQTSRYRQWTTEEDDYLREHVHDTSYENMAIVLGPSLHSVYTRRGVHGLPQARKSHRVEKPWKIGR